MAASMLCKHSMRISRAKLSLGHMQKLRQHILFSKAYETVKNGLQQKGRRASGKEDPQVRPAGRN
jgi:hypothetical protein